MAGSFLGTGMKFPPEVDPTTGRIKTVSDNESVKESIYLILMTQRMERLARPNFGSDLLSNTFMELDNTSISMFSYTLSETIREQEPRISNLEINVENVDNKGMLIVNIDYTVAGSNTPDNLVFPFYLNAEPVEENKEPEFYQPEIVEDV